MKKNNKEKAQGELKLSLYEINKNLISQLTPYTPEQITALKQAITKWDNTNVKYYMLLNNDKHYYTILYHDETKEHNDFSTLGDSVIDLLQEIGYDIMQEEFTDGHCEIWVKDNEDTLVYLLFPYDQGVIYYG